MIFDGAAPQNREKSKHLEIFRGEIIRRAATRERSNARNIKIRRRGAVFTTLSHRANNARVSTSCASGEK